MQSKKLMLGMIEMRASCGAAFKVHFSDLIIKVRFILDDSVDHHFTSFVIDNQSRVAANASQAFSDILTCCLSVKSNYAHRQHSSRLYNLTSHL